MRVSLDPKKAVIKLRKHGITLAKAADLDWACALVWLDTREDYGEARELRWRRSAIRFTTSLLLKKKTISGSSACVERPTKQYNEMSTKPEFIMNTAEEEAAINAAALSDTDALPLTDEQLAQFQPSPRRRGRPPQAITKVATNLRLDPDVLDAFKATGAGWQTQINEALREWADARGMLKQR